MPKSAPKATAKPVVAKAPAKAGAKTPAKQPGKGDHVFLVDPWWNPAAEDQAADRAHRIGQDRPVLVHRLVALDTVEERILALHEKKRGLAEAAVGGGVGAAHGITRDDLLALLE